MIQDNGVIQVQGPARFFDTPFAPLGGAVGSINAFPRSHRLSDFGIAG